MRCGRRIKERERSGMSEDASVRRAIEAVWRIESARLIASLARVVGDVGVAEDLAHDALVAALERWPETGVPDKPGAWLFVTARRKALDHVRRATRFEKKSSALAHELEDA